MANDPRYSTIRDLILKGYLKSLQEIFEKELISRSKVARDLGLNPTRFSNNLLHPERFTLKDLYNLAELVDVDGIQILQLVDADYVKNKKPRKR